MKNLVTTAFPTVFLCGQIATFGDLADGRWQMAKHVRGVFDFLLDSRDKDSLGRQPRAEPEKSFSPYRPRKSDVDPSL